MPRKKIVKKPIPGLEEIKRIIIIAMFSDDYLLDTVVLKGGNAMRIIHGLSSRASLDLDFSLRIEIEDIDAFKERVEKTLIKTFKQYNLMVIDVKMKETPHIISKEMESFWGGYKLEFKLIETEKYKFSSDPRHWSRSALLLGQKSTFSIDISRFEYVVDSIEMELDHHQIVVYTPDMIVCEKLRAICQQTDAYGDVVKRGRTGTSRARDFFDIHLLIEELKLDLTTERNVDILTQMFAIKRVDLGLLETISDTKELHRASFDTVKNTVEASVEEFDFYFNYVLELVEKLKPLWNK